MQARNSIASAVRKLTTLQRAAGKPLAIVLAGHNGSGKSTLWYDHLADELQLPLINADRMMLSILPPPDADDHLRPWAQQLRDEDQTWMRVAQNGVSAFIAQAMGQKAPFAVETVFSHWKENADGTISSKLDLLRELQRAGYFVQLVFVGLSTVELSMARVLTRKAQGGHDVNPVRLRQRFPRTQRAINAALDMVDAAILVDNSRSKRTAFTPCLVRTRDTVIYDIRTSRTPVKAISNWLDIVAPQI
ncbi:zeta toxin family protein [Alcaligenaceae bacterium C4P045]|nr:zeta toxin family protein [Alcaligenaceae bacterium C4P045]